MCASRDGRHANGEQERERDISQGPNHDADAAEIVRSFVDAVNRQDWAQVTNLVDPRIRRHSSAAGPDVEGREVLIRFLRGEFEAFPDACERVEDLLVEGPKVAVRHRFVGTQAGWLGTFAPTGKRAEADYLAIYRVEAGKIAEIWAEWDNLTVLRQLGHVLDEVMVQTRSRTYHRCLGQTIS